jgi:SPP1 family predicted phage head-tail adaptor
MTRLSDFERRFALEGLSTEDDGAGGRIESWHKLADLWVALEPSSSSESFLAGQEQSQAIHRAVLRYRGLLTPAMRLKSGDRILEITAVYEGERPMRWPVCHCREVLNP